MAHKIDSLSVRFTKNNKTLGYALGHSEGDYVAFSKGLLKQLIGGNYLKTLENATMIIIDSKTEIKVSNIVEYHEDQSVCIYCGLDSVVQEKKIILNTQVRKTIFNKITDYFDFLFK